MAFSILKHPYLPFPIKGKGNLNLMQRHAAIFIFCGLAQDHESLRGA